MLEHMIYSNYQREMIDMFSASAKSLMLAFSQKIFYT